jgi:DNA integrity scanning protein DisA with diadenylate cyclase activity
MMANLQNFIQTVSRMQWSDYLDILVVALLIYSVLPLLRTPNVMKIARTVGAVVLIAWLTNVMELYTINWILSQLLSIGLLAFVILFQPELRRMLEHIGNVKIGQLFGFTRPVQEMEAIINQTVMACEIMSGGAKLQTEEDKNKINALIIVAQDQQDAICMKDGVQMSGDSFENGYQNLQVNNAYFHDGAIMVKDGRLIAAGKHKEDEKVGALIVFSRENRLDEYFKTGTVINGRVTEQLLRNIFVNKAPLHDGAVIVQDGKIAAAGCVLPVSNSTSLSKDLGTRHRAAVGISEVSDALAVIVSEETGGISVAVDGMLKQHLTPETLEKLLRNELCPKDDSDKSRVEKVVDWINRFAKEGKK